MVFINPASLSAPSSPSASSCTHDDIDPTHSAGPSRKRARGEALTSDDRKEARAHRNRIAAQNSRDRRKAHFAYLERRVAELEEENRLLRANAGIPPPAEPTPSVSSSALRTQLEDDRVRAERDLARERENEELKERIRTLERGWEVVLKALAAQGLPTGLSSPLVSALSSASESTTTTNAEPNNTNPSSGPSTSIPVTTSMSAGNTFPSPAPSHSSLEADETPTKLADGMFSGAKEVSTLVDRESTRHLARVASIERPSLVSSVALQRVVSLSTPSRKLSISVTPNVDITDEIDDNLMEALFREIVTSPCTAGPPTAESRKVPLTGSTRVTNSSVEKTDTGLGIVEGEGVNRATQGHPRDGQESEYLEDGETEICAYSAAEWANQMEMERMLDEMIAMTGESVEMGPPYGLADSDIGLGLGMDLGVNLDVSTLVNWDMVGAY